MVTPAKGDYQGVQLNAEGRKVADAWDPAKDEAAGEQCRSYGAPALMNVPGRLHITWQDDTTLKVDTDAGTQTRLLRFPSTGSGQAAAPTPADAPRTWQGVSQARWLSPRPRPCRCSCGPPIVRRTRRRFARPADRCKSSQRICAPGTCGRTAFPTANAVLTEHWDLYKRPNGEQWLTITTQIEDPQYLSNVRLVAPVFKKEPNGSKWDPTPCSSRW